MSAQTDSPDFVQSEIPETLETRSPASDDAAPTAAPGVDALLDQTREQLRARARSRYAMTVAKRQDLPVDVTERLLTVPQTARFLGVTPGWLTRNRELIPTPLRLGDPKNPRSPLRWRLSDLTKWLDAQKVATDEHRALNQPREGGRRSGE